MDPNEYSSGPKSLTTEMNQRMRRSPEDFEQVAHELLRALRGKLNRLLTMSLFVLAFGVYLVFSEGPGANAEISSVATGILSLFGPFFLGGGVLGIAVSLWFRHDLDLDAVKQLMRDVMAGQHGKPGSDGSISA